MVWLVLAVAGTIGGVFAPLVAVALFAGLGNAVVVARAQVMVRRVRNGPPAHSTQHKTIPLTTASVSVETPEARALELARRSRRIVRVAILYTLGLPLGVMVLDTWSVHTSDPDWVVLPIVVALGYLLILSILVLGARSGAKMVKETADALPDAYLVCRATDPQRSPVVITLIVRPAGVSLCRGRGAKIRPVWELAWADITAADVCEYTFGFDIPLPSASHVGITERSCSCWPTKSAARVRSWTSRDGSLRSSMNTPWGSCARINTGPCLAELVYGDQSCGHVESPQHPHLPPLVHR